MILWAVLVSLASMGVGSCCTALAIRGAFPRCGRCGHLWAPPLWCERCRESLRKPERRLI